MMQQFTNLKHFFFFSQNSPTTTTTVTLDSDIFKAIENLIETKFSTIINSIQMIKDQMANSNSLIAQNNAQAITMLKVCVINFFYVKKKIRLNLSIFFSNNLMKWTKN